MRDAGCGIRGPGSGHHSRQPDPVKRHRIPLAGEAANRRREAPVLLRQQGQTSRVTAVGAARAVQDGAQSQDVVVGGVVWIALEIFVHGDLHASLEHSNLDGEIGQALQANVLVNGSRIRHGGADYTRPASVMQVLCAH